MKENEFAKTMELYYEKLKETFDGANVRVAQTEKLDWRNKLFLIKTTTVHDSALEDTALIIRVQVNHDGSGNELWRVSSFYGYPHLSLEKEREIVTTAGELLENMLDNGFVICETGCVKVTITNVINLSDVFGQRTSHVV